MNLDFHLHAAQLEIFNAPKRFKICTAGRRFGKSYLSAVLLLIEGLKDRNEAGHDLKKTDVWYVAPTFTQGKEIMWRMLKDLGGPVIESFHENTATATLINGRRICIKGSDRPDTLRGVPISYVVMDEYATMKPEVWELIIRPSLGDVEGGAFFIGTPAGKNHFYELYGYAQTDEDWAAFRFSSRDNPFLPKNEIDAMARNMSESAMRQELEASFESEGSGVLPAQMIRFISKEELNTFVGDDYVTVDPAGFEEVKGKVTSKLKRLDECAISRVLVHKNGWHIHEIDHGRWGIRETATRILRAYQKSRPVSLGIEKGSLKNAVIPYLDDEQMRLRIHFKVYDLTHGGKKKTERISWALQGRLEREKITILEEDRHKPWVKALISQMHDFPNPMAHDDLVDSLAYIDQLATTNYLNDFEWDQWEPLDAETGY